MSDSKNSFEGLSIACLADQNVEAVLSAFAAHRATPAVFAFDPVGETGLDESNPEFANRVLTADIDTVIFVTGVGVHYVVDQASRTVDRQRFLDSLTDANTIAGSSKAESALKELGLNPTISVDRAVSWRDILMAVDRNAPVVNQVVGLEESAAVYGLASGLEARGARVVRIPVFAQSLPNRQQPAIDFFEQIEAFEFQAILFPSPQTAAKFCFLAKHFGRARLTSHLLDNHIVLTIGEDAAEILADRGFVVDYTTQATEMGPAIDEIASQIERIKNQKTVIRINRCRSRWASIKRQWHLIG